MDLWNTPMAPDRRIHFHQLGGDQEVQMGADISLFREGACVQVPVGSPVYVLAGNQGINKFWSHNVSISENGQFLPRDDTGTCGLIGYCDDDTVKFWSAASGAKGTAPVWVLQTTMNLVTGIWTYVGALVPSQTAGLTGTTAANNANAGAFGEFTSATLASPGTSLTTATPANVVVAGLSLTAGDWDVWASVAFLPAATTNITQLAAGLNLTTGTLPTPQVGLSQTTFTGYVPGAIPQCMDVMQIRVSQASTAAVFLVAQGAFTVSTLSAFGTIYARRAR